MTEIPTNMHPIVAHAAIGDKIKLRGKWRIVGFYWVENGFQVKIVSYRNDHYYAKDRSGRRIRSEYYLCNGDIITSLPYYNRQALIDFFKRLSIEEKKTHANRYS